MNQFSERVVACYGHMTDAYMDVMRLIHTDEQPMPLRDILQMLAKEGSAKLRCDSIGSDMFFNMNEVKWRNPKENPRDVLIYAARGDAYLVIYADRSFAKLSQSELSLDDEFESFQ